MCYATEREGQEPRYSKHPSKWLDGGHWEDEAPEAPDLAPVSPDTQAVVV